MGCDVDQTTAQATAYERLLDALTAAGSRVQTRGGDRAAATCPAHDDRAASLSVSRGTKGAVLTCQAGCDREDVLAAIGLRMADLFDKPAERRGRPKIQDRYRYEDENGIGLYMKIRYLPKSFSQCRLDEHGMPMSGGLGDVRRVLYHLPILVASAKRDPEAVVYLVEGEKDANDLSVKGYIATTWGDGAWAVGAKPKWRPEYTDSLAGRNVVIIADNDATGLNSAEDIRRIIGPAVKSVRIVVTKCGKDWSDHAAAGYGVDDLVPYEAQESAAVEPVKAAEPSTPGTTFLGMREEHHGQLRLAYRFAHQHGGRMMHVTGLGWHAWDGTRWAFDQDGAADRAVMATLKESLHAIAHLDDQKARKALLNDVTKAESAGGIAGVLRIAQSLPGMTATVKSLDADPWLLNTPDGTVNLRTGKMHKHDPADRITKITGSGFSGGGHEVFKAFIERVLPDEEVRAFVQRLLGYSLLGEVREHVLPIWVGDGANGKGTLRDIVRYCLGDYGIEVDPGILMSGPEKHPTERMDLLGARFVACSETNRNAGLNEATMKRLVGGDPIRARRMRQDMVEFLPTHTLVMMTNQLPKVSGDDGGVWRRILVIPFDVVIPKHERNTQLRGQLEAEAAAVMSWIWDGWLAYRDQGLTPPEAVQARTEEYQADSDSVGRFLADRMLSGPHFHVAAREAYAEYVRWCSDAGEQHGSEKEFAEAMRRKGVGKRRTKAGFVYDGIGLAADDEEPDADEEPEQTQIL